MFDRWNKIFKGFYNEKKGKFDISKIPDIYVSLSRVPRGSWGSWGSLPGTIIPQSLLRAVLSLGSGGIMTWAPLIGLWQGSSCLVNCL
jgi:hypothetical protein